MPMTFFFQRLPNYSVCAGVRAVLGHSQQISSRQLTSQSRQVATLYLYRRFIIVAVLKGKNLDPVSGASFSYSILEHTVIARLKFFLKLFFVPSVRRVRSPPLRFLLYVKYLAGCWESNPSCCDSS